MSTHRLFLLSTPTAKQKPQSTTSTIYSVVQWDHGDQHDGQPDQTLRHVPNAASKAWLSFTTWAKFPLPTIIRRCGIALLLGALIFWVNKTTSNSTIQPKSDRPLSQPSSTRSPHSLSLEEEAMFDQYQAVGLGNNTLEEAYAPVLRTYAPPPNGNIYSTFGVVMASYRPHAVMLHRFFDSMVKYCLDCDRVRIALIVPIKDVELFNDIRTQYIEVLPGIEIVPFSHIFPALNTTLAKQTPGWPSGWTGWSEDRLLKSKDKAIFQSFKKIYGCLYLAKEHCMLLDSEGFFIRQSSLADIYGGFRKSPHVVYSSYVRQRFFATKSAQDLLGYHENYGWTLEEYNWSMDTNIIAELERIFRRARPNLENMEPLVFIEVVYWIYIMHNHHRYPRLRVLDTANLFGLEVLDKMRRLVNFDDNAITPWEDLRWYMEKDPSLVDVAVDMFNKYKFKMFKTGKSKESIALLERAPSIVMCVSEQPEEVYQMAMKGHFNQTLPEGRSKMSGKKLDQQ